MFTQTDVWLCLSSDSLGLLQQLVSIPVISREKVQCGRFEKCHWGHVTGWGQGLCDGQGLRGVLQVESILTGVLARA